MIKLLQIPRKYIPLFLFLFSIQTCSHTHFATLVERPPQSQSNILFFVTPINVKVVFRVIRHPICELQNYQLIFRIFGGAANLNNPIIKIKTSIVINQTVELEISKLDEVLSESAFSLISIDID